MLATPTQPELTQQKGKSKVPSSIADAAFEQALSTILAGLGSHPQLQDEMRHGMLKQYHEPPLELISKVLATTVSVDDVRRLIFYPTESDMMLYPRLLAKNDTLTRDEQRKVNPTLLYLLHAKEWSKMKVDMFTIDDIHLRSQALDAFLQITSVVDWFTENQQEEPTKESRLKMAQLSACGFVKGLIWNKDAEFPGGSYCALQVLAFWLSWIRYFYAVDRKLPVSKEILDALKEWSEKKDISDEEHDLAQQVFTDFARLPTTEDLHFSESIREASSYESAMMLKQKGNDAYREKIFVDAIDWYTKAIAMCSNEPTVYCNRAMASLMALESGIKVDQKEIIERSISDCQKALELKPDYAKASVYLEKFQSKQNHQ